MCRILSAGVVALCVLSLSGTAMAGTSGDFAAVFSSGQSVSCAAAPFSEHKTGDFCDSTADHGSSASCEAEGIANGKIKCANGASPFNINCNVGQNCNNNNGHWCNCTFHCPGSDADPDADADGEQVTPR